MEILSRFFKSVVRKNTTENETHKTPCNPNAHWDRKRCKSCNHFTKIRLKCLCDRDDSIINPWQKACENYKKRKIKARDLKYGKRSA